MADGMFDSGGSGGDFSYSDFSTRSYGRGGPHLSVGALLGILLVGLVLLVVCTAYQNDVLRAERELDATEYVGTSRANFDAWQAAREDDIKPGTLWFEPGSSHRRSQYGSGDYHCKGGQFEREDGSTVTFCCSVKLGARPSCLVL